MCSRSISWLLCIFVAAVTAANDPNVITETDPAVTVNRFRTYNQQWSMVESVQKVKEITAQGLDVVLDIEDSAIMTSNTRLVAHRTVLATSKPELAAMNHRNMPETSTSQVTVQDPVLRQLLVYLYTIQAPTLPGNVPYLLNQNNVYNVPSMKVDHERQVAAKLPEDAATAAPVQLIKHSSDNLGQANVDMGRHHSGQMRTQPEEVEQQNWLLIDRQAATSAPTTAETRTTPTTSQTQSGHSDNTQTLVSSVPPTVSCPNTPLDDVEVSFFRSLSDQEKGRRLIEAAKHGEVDDVRTLLAAGAYLGAKTMYGRTALHWAAWNGHEVAAVCLLDAGADTGAMDNEKYRPLHMAALGGHPGVVRLLAAWGADVNARDIWDYTPLHLTVRDQRTEAAVALLESGANREARNEDGCTPLDMAKENQYQQMIDILTQH